MKRKWWVVAIGIALLAGAAGAWYGFRQDEEPVRALTMPTAVVRKGTLISTISGTGSIEPAEREDLTASGAGTVAAVFFKDGDPVKAGDILITFEQDEKDVSRQIESKRISLEKARLELESLQQQYKNAVREEQNTDQILLNIRAKELDIRQIEYEIADLQEPDETIAPITAPIDGKLVGFKARAGDVIRADSTLGEVVNYDRLKLVVRVDELDISKVALGQRAEILVDALPDRVYGGVVTAIADEGSQSNGVAMFDVTILLDESDGLKAGMSAEASIVTMRKDDALYVPIAAVQSVRGEYFVLVPGEEDAGSSAVSPLPGRERERTGMTQPPGVRRVSVEVGVHNEDYIEIVSGLAEGDTVIVPGAASDGSRQAGQMARPGGFGGAGFPQGGFSPGGSPGGGGGFPGGGFQGGGFPGGGGYQGGQGGGFGGSARGGGR